MRGAAARAVVARTTPALRAGSRCLQARVEQVEQHAHRAALGNGQGGFLLLNNRRIKLRGASIHEDFPGRGAALTPADMDTIVRELKELGANVTRSHYVLSEGLLQRLDRAGSWSGTRRPFWQRDRRRRAARRRRATARMRCARSRGTVVAARNHPSVIIHSVANELAFKADRKPETRRFTARRAKAAREPRPHPPDRHRYQGRAPDTASSSPTGAST